MKRDQGSPSEIANRGPGEGRCCLHTVCTKNLNPSVLMMKSAQDSVRTYDAGSLNRTRNRRIFVQGSMRSDEVVIIGVRFQSPAQMLLAEDDEVIQTLTPDRSYSRSAKPFCQGEAGEMGLSRMPMARNRRVTTAP